MVRFADSLARMADAILGNASRPVARVTGSPESLPPEATSLLDDAALALLVLCEPPSPTLPLRPEDARLTAPGAGRITARVYAVELIGDHTLVTCQFGGAILTVKADKSAAHDMDAPVGIDFPDRAAFLFDSDSGDRIRPPGPAA